MRKLATAALAFSGAVFLANYILPSAWLLPCALVFAAAGGGLAAMKRRWLRGAVIAGFAFALGLAFFRLYSGQTVVQAEKLDGVETEISGVLLEYPSVYESYCRGRVLIKTDGLPQLEAVVYDSSMGLAQAEPGQIVHFIGKLRPAGTRYGEKYDYYYSQGIYLIANVKGTVSAEDGGFSLGTIPMQINREIASLAERLFPADTAAFMKALMLGDKTDLYQDTALYNAMNRAGITHVVAVSGMHIAFLVGLIRLLLGATRKSSLLCIALVWLFVLVTGGSPSAVRAGVMQSFLLFAPVVRRENDPPTSLSAALALILLSNPYAAASVSLQLSFAAIAGILCFAERINEALRSMLLKKAGFAPLDYIVATAASSLSVMVFTVPLTALHFGTIALLSPLTNILILWAVSLCFGGGYAVCAVGVLFPSLGRIGAGLVTWAAKYIFAVSGLVAKLSLATIYMDGAAALGWLALVYLLFIIAASSRLKIWAKFILPASLSVLCLLSFLGAARLNYQSGTGVISVLDVGQGQCICVFSGDKTVLIDCGGLNSLDNAGETAGAYLKSRGRDRVDLLLLTHLHADHANGVELLLEMTEIGEIIMPSSPNDDDGLWEQIIGAAEKHNVPVSYLNEDSVLAIGGIQAALYAPGEAGDTNERCMMARLSLGEYDFLVTGDAPKKAERELAEAHDLSGTELLIVGHHGSRYASSGELLKAAGGDTAIISVGYNSYGHPTNETLERLAAYGYNIYRTDLSGNIEIRIGNHYG